MIEQPSDLIDRLEGASLDDIITIYNVASGYIKLYEEVKNKALVLAQEELDKDGVVHSKTEAGTCGYTISKKEVLDKDKWMKLCEIDGLARDMQYNLDEEIELMRQYQKDNGCFVLPPGRFYIR